LPVYDVFYEPRWFIPGDARPPVEVAGRRLGVLVCEDIWDDAYGRHPAAEPALAAAEALLCLSASPYRQGVGAQRLRQARRAGALAGGRPIVYVNAVGANDELIFDGGSFVLDGGGRPAAILPPFREAVRVVDLDELGNLPAPPPPLGREEELLQALTLGTRDFCRKNGIRRAFVGLSGGIDSALVAAIAARALGPESVTALALPTRYNDARSTESARLLAGRLGVAFEVVPIDGLLTAAEELLRPRLGSGGPDDTTYENIQARLRALVLMAFVNRRGGVLLNTSNKSELALGYSTLYGDMAGALGVIADLPKPDVYALARHINASAGAEVIPAFILDRPPSAELRPDQVDPFDYGRVSPLVESLVQNRPPPPPLPGPDELARSRRMVRVAEHKRWQFGIVLKVSERAFGTGRLVPVTRLDPSVPPPGKSC
jgi:NAD+ synthase (glutamine-hydrolysing)